MAGRQPTCLEDIKRLGWRGPGLWTRGNVTEAAARQRVQWSKHAGIEYWKIDGGGTQHFYSCRIKEAIFPELQLEYICGANGPLNQHWDDPDRTEYPSPYAPGYNRHQPAWKILRNADTFRTMVLRLEGRSLPVAGHDFIPARAPVRPSPTTGSW